MIENLKKLGLNGYEANVYVALVGLGEATAREISENSDVPRPKVYDTVKSLEERGFVEVQQGNPTHFRPMDPRKVISKLETDTIRAAEECIHNLEGFRVEKDDKSPSVWMVRGDWAVTTKVQELINSAQNDILVEAFNKEFLNELSPYLAEVKEKAKCVFVGEVDERDSLPNDIGINFVNIENLRGREPLGGLIKFMTEGIQSEGVRYEPEGNITVDEKVNIKIHRENGRKTAIISRVPISSYMHKNIVEHILREVKSE